MKPLATPRASHVYVVKLHEAPVADRSGARLSGRLEHVASGRRHDFDTGAALLACLVHEEAQEHLPQAADPAGGTERGSP